MNSGLWRLSNNEREFIQAALREDQRVDGRKPFDVRQITISFSKHDGAVEVQQGSTRVMAVVTGQLGPPYQDRPTEGSLAIYTEFSPMADPAFDVGRPAEMAVELGRIIDRGLRESRAVDTESLCVLAGIAVWAIRIDIHILDNGGNLVDVANIAALAALLSYRRPECSIGGRDGQEVIVHPPEVREPVSLILHHLPIAVTFAFFGSGDIQVVDPSLKEEAVMGGRLTVTVNAQGDICAIQKGGGVGVSAGEILRCVRIASSKASDITDLLKRAVESNNIERATRKIKRHTVPTFHDVTSCRPLEDDLEDEQMAEMLASSSIPDDQKEAVLDMIKAERMEVSTSSDSEVEEDRIDEKKQKVEGLVGIRSVSGRNGVTTAKVQASKGGLFEGGMSYWDDKDDDQGSTVSAKPFDSDAMAEFDNVAAVLRTNMLDTGRLSSAKSAASISAAVVYAQISDQSTGVSRSLGPVFPQIEGNTGSEAEQPASPLRVLSGVELKPAPTSLLDAVKRKRKKGKNP